MFKGLSESIFGKKSIITDKLLSENNVNLIKKGEFAIDKAIDLVLTPTGKFYLGKYKNAACCIKILDKASDQTKLNELIFWQSMYKNDKIFLDFYGAFINGNELFLFFEAFKLTLDRALTMNILKDSIKLLITKNMTNVLQKLQISKKVHMGLRPGAFCLKENGEIKLVDYGNILKIEGDSQVYAETIDMLNLKYMPPEKINFLTEEKSSDIWSFGCILIDIFSRTEPLYKMNISLQELQALHDYESFPPIPQDITGLLRDIISNCLNPNFINRIKIADLVSSMGIFLSNYEIIIEPEDKRNKNYDESRNPNSEVPYLRDPDLQDHYSYMKSKEKSLQSAEQLINEEFMISSINAKNEIGDFYNQAIALKEEKTKIILNEISGFAFSSTVVLMKLKEKILNRIIQIQEIIATASSSIFSVKGTLNELKANISSLSILSNSKTYINLMHTIEQNRNTIEAHFKKYSKDKDYDVLSNHIQEMKNLIGEFKSYAFNEVHMLHDIMDSIRKCKKDIYTETNIAEFSKNLNIDAEVSELLVYQVVNPELLIESLYIKFQEDSDIIVAFDQKNKTVIQHKITANLLMDQLQFYSDVRPAEAKWVFIPKSNGSFRKTDSSIYISGGKSKNQILNFFYKCSVVVVNSELIFCFEQLSCMQNCRFSHSSIFILNEEFLVVVGGNTNKTCEVYCVSSNEWYPLPSMVSNSPNCSLCESNGFLYCFNSGADYSSYAGIYRINLKNFKNKYVSQIIGFSQDEWEDIDYSHYNSNCYLKRGMCAVPYLDNSRESIYLFGGYNTDRSFYEILEFNIKADASKPYSEIKRDNVEVDPDSDLNSSKLLTPSDKDPPNETKILEDNSIENLEVQILSPFTLKLLPYEMPVATFFNSNPILNDNGEKVTMMCGQFNIIEFDFRLKGFQYYT